MSHSRADLSCRHVVEMVTDYLEGDLAPEDRAQLEQHLVICDPCIDYIEQSRLTVEALRQLPRDPVTPSARSALMDAFRKLKREDEP